MYILCEWIVWLDLCECVSTFTFPCFPLERTPVTRSLLVISGIWSLVNTFLRRRDLFQLALKPEMTERLQVQQQHMRTTTKHSRAQNSTTQHRVQLTQHSGWCDTVDATHIESEHVALHNTMVADTPSTPPPLSTAACILCSSCTCTCPRPSSCGVCSPPPSYLPLRVSSCWA